MARQPFSLLLTLTVFVPGLQPDAGAQANVQEISSPVPGMSGTSCGIRADRLPPGNIRDWRKIQAIVFAHDASGRLIHIRLHSLWQWVETSGHVVYIEFVPHKDRWDNQAGRFRIEKVDPLGKSHVAAIELCLPVIDEALVRKRARGTEGFIQYEGLNRWQRYAEMLGHELAHAVWALGDQDRTWLIYSLDREIDLNSRRRKSAHGTAWNDEKRQLLSRLESWREAIEEPARTAEAEVWFELRDSAPKR